MQFKLNGYEFVIRQCTKNDYRFVYSILKHNMSELFFKHWGGWNPKAFRDGYDKNNIKIVEYKKRRIAYIDYKFVDDFTYISNIQISTRYRRKGLGTYLMDMIENDSKSNDIRRIRLTVFEDNHAKFIYFRRGYAKVKESNGSLLLEKILL